MLQFMIERTNHVLLFSSVLLFMAALLTSSRFSVPPHTKTAAIVVNIKSSGASGDGITDDTLSIQNAINQAAALGGRVYIPAGTYAVTGLALYNNIDLVGDGYQSVLKLKDNTNKNIIEVIGRSHVTIQNITIDGNNPANTGAGNGVAFSNTKFSALYNTRVINVHSSGIIIERGSSGITVSNNLFENMALGYGVSVSTSDTALIANNMIINTAGNGINISNSKFTSVTGNVIRRNSDSAGTLTSGYAGVRYTNGSRHASITGNSISNFSRGIFTTTGSSYIAITGNNIQNTGYQGMLIETVASTGDSPDTYITVSGNTILNPGRNEKGSEGIQLQRIKHSIVTGNTITDDAEAPVNSKMYHGILTTMQSDANIFTGNVVTNVNPAGEGILAEGTQNQIGNNIIK